MNVTELVTNVNDGLHGVASSTGVDIATLAGAALIFGVLAAVTPKKLSLVPIVYLVGMTAVIYMHQMQAVHLGMIAGVVAAVLLYPFRTKKTA